MNDTERLEARLTLNKLFEALTERQQLVCVQRAEGLTLSEVGELIGLSTERVRQIVARALRQMRVRYDHHGAMACLTSEPKITPPPPQLSLPPHLLPWIMLGHIRVAPIFNMGYVLNYG